MGLNFRVRNGNGCGPHSMDGGKNFFNSLNNTPDPNGESPTDRVVQDNPIIFCVRDKSREECVSGQASRAISTGQLRTSLPFHIQPINVLVSDDPSGDRSPREILSWGGLPT